MTSQPALARRLGLVDAVWIGLGSMIGAGIFASLAPAADAAGTGLLVGLAIAAVVAVCNATSSAQLAAQYPTSGGTYVYGRERLGAWPGFLAGWSFVIGKTASCAAMALTFASYAAPVGWEKPVAVAGIVAVAAVNYFGVTRTAGATKVIVGFVLIVLGVVLAAGVSAGAERRAPLTPGLLDLGWLGILQSAGLLFFAFAGYARIATMGEEVRAPARTIPRAIVLTLCIALTLYAAVAVTALGAVGPQALARSTAPLADVVETAGWTAAVPLVGIGAAAASLGALLALVAGIGRTSLAMARHGDLPSWLGAVHPHRQVPHHAEIALTVVVAALVVTVDLRGVIGFSSFGVLLYYLIANVSALTQSRSHRRYPRVLPVVGVLGCLLLVATLPIPSILGGLAVLAVGLAGRAVALRRRSTSS